MIKVGDIVRIKNTNMIYNEQYHVEDIWYDGFICQRFASLGGTPGKYRIERLELVLPRTDTTQQTFDPAKNCFYMVKNVSKPGTATATIHRTYESAKTEATRLARLEVGQKFAVMKSYTCVSVDDMPVIENLY